MGFADNVTAALGLPYKLNREKEGNLKIVLEKRSMDFETEASETSQARMQSPRAHGKRKPNLEQPKRLVYKKIIKPLMEKKRRDRIAHSLNQLKALLLDVPNQGNKSFPSSRTDKAALLEMTVKRIQTLQLAVADDRGFQTGCLRCASFAPATISEKQPYPEPPSQSIPNNEIFSLVTPPQASGLEKISSWNEEKAAFRGLQRPGKPVSSMVLSRTGSHGFWRPWST
ncbi:protein deadpan [Anolis carolinensis]|uniref:protein deadpan n=1 Tax=Anolis carolinensis TaxID=28377 RepID=UPI00046253F7|nr:PREDICTED: protein deadpan [Anolis carolinensis]|eukprot:XP_003226508.2 PREDICTED: protein deadpan [Anolis carolinensis]